MCVQDRVRFQRWSCHLQGLLLMFSMKGKISSEFQTNCHEWKFLGSFTERLDHFIMLLECPKARSSSLCLINYLRADTAWDFLVLIILVKWAWPGGYSPECNHWENSFSAALPSVLKEGGPQKRNNLLGSLWFRISCTCSQLLEES